VVTLTRCDQCEPNKESEQEQEENAGDNNRGQHDVETNADRGQHFALGTGRNDDRDIVRGVHGPLSALREVDLVQLIGEHASDDRGLRLVVDYQT
jgi:hypothetical protein